MPTKPSQFTLGAVHPIHAWLAFLLLELGNSQYRWGAGP